MQFQNRVFVSVISIVYIITKNGTQFPKCSASIKCMGEQMSIHRLPISALDTQEGQRSTEDQQLRFIICLKSILHPIATLPEG